MNHEFDVIGSMYYWYDNGLQCDHVPPPYNPHWLWVTGPSKIVFDKNNIPISATPQTSTLTPPIPQASNGGPTPLNPSQPQPIPFNFTPPPVGVPPPPQLSFILNASSTPFQFDPPVVQLKEDPYSTTGHFHLWKPYVGFTEVYDYCIICDEKRK